AFSAVHPSLTARKAVRILITSVFSMRLLPLGTCLFFLSLSSLAAQDPTPFPNDFPASLTYSETYSESVASTPDGSGGTTFYVQPATAITITTKASLRGFDLSTVDDTTPVSFQMGNFTF